MAQENNQFSFNIVDHSVDRYLELKAREALQASCSGPPDLSNAKVMNSNVMRDDSLGSIRVDTRSIDPGQWLLGVTMTQGAFPHNASASALSTRHHYRLKLEEGQGGEPATWSLLFPVENRETADLFPGTPGADRQRLEFDVFLKPAARAWPVFSPSPGGGPERWFTARPCKPQQRADELLGCGL